MYRFYLTYNNVQTEVEEPKGWSDFKSDEIKRDFKSHGVIFKYTSGTLKLGFADGRDILNDAFRLEGVDAEVTLTVEKRNTNQDSWNLVFTGEAVMKNRDYGDLYFEVDFEASSYQQKIINRLDVPVDIERTLDLDGNTLSGSISKQTDTFNTIRLYRYFEALFFEEDTPINTQISTVINDLASSDTSTRTQLFTFGAGAVKKLDTLTQINIDKTTIDGTNGTYEAEENKPTPIFTASTEGEAQFTGRVTYVINQSILHNATADIQLDYALKLVQYRNGTLESSNTIVSEIYTALSQPSPSTSVSWGVTATPKQESWDITISDVESGDNFYLVFETNGSASAGTNIKFSNLVAIFDDDNGDENNSFINITQLPARRAASLQHYLVHDAFKRLAYIITGQQNGFYSDFFGLTDHGYASDGCGALNTITNGSKLRGLNEYTPNLSMRDMIDWAQARYGVGWSFENTGSGYRIRVEPMEYFYDDVEILDIGNDVEKGSYTEKSFSDLEINQVKIGYSTYFNEIGINGLFEDFLTESIYSLPIKTIKGNYTQKSPLIASNDIIQATYDKRGDKDSWKYDEDIFLIAVTRNGAGFIEENDENFSSVAGLDDPSSAYNIRHAPVYMMLDHALLINSALMGKSLSEKIQNTTAKVNINFAARGTNYACLLGDTQQLLRTSVGDLEIGDNYEGNRLFEPIQHELKVAMTSTQLNTIIDAMENNGVNNYGYLSYRDNEGNPQQGYPILIQWNPNDEIANITTLERADNYGV
jgi:hypothetical protein